MDAITIVQLGYLLLIGIIGISSSVYTVTSFSRGTSRQMYASIVTS